MLRELQDAMGRALLQDFKAPPPADLLAGASARAAARFMVHRGNVVESLANALGEAFPRAKTICGEHNFRVLAAAFVRAHPPTRPELHAYGADFPGFVAGHGAALRDHPYLADLARLEWALHDAYFAPDAPALTPEALGAVPPERLPALRFTLHPAVRVVVSGAHPIFTLRTADPLPDPLPPRGEAVLVARPGGDVEAIALDAGEAAFLGAVAAGAPLESAVAEAEQAAPGFDLAAALAAALSRGAFGAEVSFHPTSKETSP